MDEQEVFNKLLPLIREVTGARADQIHLDSCFMEDLGAESIDLLDLSFLVEETFEVTLEADELERQASEHLSGQPYEQNGYLTTAALAELKQALPEVPPDKFRPGLKRIEVPSLLTVAVFVHLIQRKQKEKQQDGFHAE